MKKVFLCSFLIVLSLKTFGTILNSASFNIKYLQNGIYEINLEIEYDRYSDFFDPDKLKVGLYSKSTNNLIKVIEFIDERGFKTIPTDLKCVKGQPYFTLIKLKANITIDSTFLANNYSTVGYYLYWEKCCLSPSYINAYKPSEQAIAAYLEIPKFFNSNNINDRFINNSPTIKLINNPAFCINREDSIDMEFIDLDGDSLVYKFVEPFSATYTSYLSQNSNFGPQPYLKLNWNTNYSLEHFIDLKKPIYLDSKSGKIKLYPSKPGNYFITLAVEEYRNGIKIGVTQRNILFLFTKCPLFITNILNNQFISIGDTAKLKVKISEPIAKFQWQQKNYDKYINLPNQTSDSLLIVANDTNLNGNIYRCWVIANLCGVFSNDAQIFVNTVGINTHKNINHFILYPNPSNHQVTIKGIENPQKISVYSLEGKLLKEIFNSSTFDVSDILPGMYLVRVTDEKNHSNYYAKLIVGE